MGHEQKKAFNRLEQMPASPPADPIFGSGLAFLISKGISEQRARSILGKLRKDVGNVEASRLLSQAEKQDISAPVGWLEAASKSHRQGKVSDDFREITYQGTPADQQPAWARGAA
ncbi:hypothetical protein [Lysobacter arenosi]|nr:hypothetical protein [Lysobacter arenosi]